MYLLLFLSPNMSALYNMLKAELVPGHRGFCFIFCKNTNSKSDELQSIYFTVCAEWLILHCRAVLGPCSCLAGWGQWEVLCLQGTGESWLTQWKNTTFWVWAYPTGDCHWPFWLVAVIAERSTSRRRRANLLITQARRSKCYQEGDITHLLAEALFL